MKAGKIMRLISLVMLIVAVVFVFCALACPTLGKTIYIGDFAFGAKQWRFCYKVYAVVMLILFVASFFVKKSGINSKPPSDEGGGPKGRRERI